MLHYAGSMLGQSDFLALVKSAISLGYLKCQVIYYSKDESKVESVTSFMLSSYPDVASMCKNQASNVFIDVTFTEF